MLERVAVGRQRRKWMTREEWSKHVRTPYYDLFDDLPVSGAFADYATPEEIVAILATPVDDAAWEAELRWRAWLESRVPIRTAS